MSAYRLRVAVVGAPGSRRDEAVLALRQLTGVRVLRPRGARPRPWRLAADVAVAVAGPGTVPADLRLVMSLTAGHRTHVLGLPCSHADRLFLELSGAVAYHHDVRSLAAAVAAEPGRRRRRWLAALPNLGRGTGGDRTDDLLVEAACELTRRREQERYARLLHDRVLQTMEMLSRPESELDARLREQVRKETRWLRGLLEHGPGDLVGTGDVCHALADTVAEHDSPTLRVTLSARYPGPGWPDLRSETVDALCDATSEALHNVRKHARTGAAHVIARPYSGGVKVRIRDRGTGFDPARVRSGFGLSACVQARLAEVGGSADVCSALGTGTEVSLVVPAPESP
ncbi:MULTISPECIES: sensor histidine kinase [unclassified Micromonospora]|uniref:sensor histidine kinase n=1 Tax=unclassified Micromonospora TaxID=2617518 RepID=UPI003A884CE2